MSKSEIINHLTYLYKHDLALCDVYKDVIKNVGDQGIKKRLEEFLKDHENHLHTLERLIQDHEGDKPSDWRDLKGVLLDLYTQLRALTGNKGALKALQTAEKSALSAYEKEAPSGLSEEAQKRLRKHLEDERKHGEYLESLDL